MADKICVSFLDITESRHADVTLKPSLTADKIIEKLKQNGYLAELELGQVCVLQNKKTGRIILPNHSFESAGIQDGDVLIYKVMTRDDGGIFNIEILKNGDVKKWNDLRQQYPHIEVNLRRGALVGANLAGADIDGVDLHDAKLVLADLDGVHMSEANLKGAVLAGASLRGADLSITNFTGAVLEGANLSDADLTGANLTNTNLTKANLGYARLNLADCIGTNFTNADLSFGSIVGAKFKEANLDSCVIYGISAWDVILENTTQKNLRIVNPMSTITVDNIKIAQFIYLLLSNPEIRDVLDTVSTKIVLILGRFTDDRKPVLDTIRNELRMRNYVPVLFDFSIPNNRDITETVSTLAHLARFVIADITDAKSIPQELMAIVPNLPSVPIQPLLLSSTKEYGMFEHFKRYPWVLSTFEYDNIDHLVKTIEENIIRPAEEMANKQRPRRE